MATKHFCDACSQETHVRPLLVIVEADGWLWDDCEVDLCDECRQRKIAQIHEVLSKILPLVRSDGEAA